MSVRDTENGLGSEAAHTMYGLIVQHVPPQYLATVWNAYMDKLAEVEKTAPPKGKLITNYKRLRYEFTRYTIDHIQSMMDVLMDGRFKVRPEAPKKKRKPDIVELMDRVDQVAEQQPPERVAADVQPTLFEKPAHKPEKQLPKMSETERQIMLAVSGAVHTPAPFTLPVDDLSEDDKALMVEELAKQEEHFKRHQGFVQWACRLADSEADRIQKLSGEELWKQALSVETYPEDPGMKLVFVRSSTAPMLGQGPIVRHDFRANGKHVSINHDQMFKQLDGQRLIRSRNIKAKDHVYYVKVLQYEEGMYLKGYFQVNDEVREELARYFVVEKGKIRQLNSVTEYRELENRSASGMRKV